MLNGLLPSLVKRTLALSVLMGLMIAVILPSNFATIQSASAASAGDRVTDFNGDGYEDLVVGVPDEWINKNLIQKAGGANVIYGSSSGISPNISDGTGGPDQFWDQNSPNVPTSGLVSEDFGYSIATGDFNSDGYSDVAIGQPGGPVGEVTVIYGSADSGLSSTPPTLTPQVFNQDTPGVQGVEHSQEAFGKSLAAGDFDGDGYDDLAIGNPREDIWTSPMQFDAGAVTVLYGSSAGLSPVPASDGTGRDNQFWSQNKLGIKDISETNDLFGSAVAAGDLNGDGYDDLAVGVPGEGPYASSPQTLPNMGAANIIYGSPTGLSATFVPNQFFNILSPLLEEADVFLSSHSFGSSLAAADFNSDGNDDLVIGIPGGVESGARAGVSVVIYGSSPSGLSEDILPVQKWHQHTLNGGMLNDENFGTSFATGDFNADDYADLAIGVPNDVIGTKGHAGSVNIIYGSEQGLAEVLGPSDPIFNQDAPNMNEVAEEGDGFGWSLVSGDYNGDAYDDLAIGVPFEHVNTNSVADAGAVNVIYGSSEGLSATPIGEGNGRDDQVWTQASPNVEESVGSFELFGWALG